MSFPATKAAHCVCVLCIKTLPLINEIQKASPREHDSFGNDEDASIKPAIKYFDGPDAVAFIPYYSIIVQSLSSFNAPIILALTVNSQCRLVGRPAGRITSDTRVTSRVLRCNRLDQQETRPWPEFPDAVSHELRQRLVLVRPANIDGGVTHQHHARQLGCLSLIDRLIPKIERTDPW